MDEVLDRAVADLVERVYDAHDVGRHFLTTRHQLPPDGVVRVHGVDEARHVGRHRPLEQAGGGVDGGALVGRRREVALERVQGADAVAHLPPPVRPLGDGGVVLRASGHAASTRATRSSVGATPRTALLSSVSTATVWPDCATNSTS